MKKILIVSAVYPPEPVVSARLAQDLYEHFKKKGYSVTVLCPKPSRYSGNWNPQDDSPDVVRLNSYTCKEYSVIGRFRESWSFGRCVSNYIEAHYIKTHSEEYVHSSCYLIAWAIFGVYFASRAAHKHGMRVVHHVQDLYPEALRTKLHGWKYRLAYQLFMPYEKKTAQWCDYSLLLTDKLKQTFCQNRKVSPEKVEIFPNWLNESDFIKNYSKEKVCQQYGIQTNTFTFMYFGNIGPLAGVGTAIRAFGKLTQTRDQSGVQSGYACQFVIAGEGSAKEQCKKIVQDEKIENVIFISEPDAHKVGMIQSVADVMMLPMKSGPGSTSVPSKLMAYMLSGKPVLASVDMDSEVADEIERADCGIVVQPENESAIAEGMRRFITASSEQLNSWGMNARNYGLIHYSKKTALERMAKLLIWKA